MSKEALTWPELVATLEQANIAADAYIAATPPWVQVWIMFMTVVLAPSFVFAIFRREARYIAAALACTMIFTPFFIAVAGTSLSWGMTHLFFWPVAVLAALLSIRRLPLKSLYTGWLILALLVMTISIGFDAWDVFRFINASPAGTL